MPKNVLLISMFVLFYSKKKYKYLNIYIYMNKKFEYDEEF